MGKQWAGHGQPMDKGCERIARKLRDGALYIRARLTGAFAVIIPNTLASSYPLDLLHQRNSSNVNF